MTEGIAHIGLLDPETIALDISALEMAALDRDAVDLAPYLALLDELADGVRTRGAAAGTPDSRATVLAEILARDHGFMGDAFTYDDPANADLIAVIDRRRGLPISLSILYVALARRAGWDADALNVPGHVLVRIGTASDHVVVDPFNGGTIVDDRRMAELFEKFGRPVRIEARQLQPLTNRGVLVRLLMNQATRAEQGGDVERALAVYERMTVISPEHGQAWWERARLELALGDRPAARSSLTALLETTRDPAMRGRVKDALARLA